MSREDEKLCANCGYALGFPGPARIRLSDGGEVLYVHDLPGVESLEQSIICPCCSQLQRWTSDCAKVRLMVAEKRVRKERAS